jgi:hypothetical protein
LLIGLAGLWFIFCLVRRRTRGLLGSAALLGVGISLLLAAQGIAPLGVTLIGLMLITSGASLLLRGLLF